jgi:hypothetical protein
VLERDAEDLHLGIVAVAEDPLDLAPRRLLVPRKLPDPRDRETPDIPIAEPLGAGI